MSQHEAGQRDAEEGEAADSGRAAHVREPVSFGDSRDCTLSP
jgi:hypothetical protein